MNLKISGMETSRTDLTRFYESGPDEYEKKKEFRKKNAEISERASPKKPETLPIHAQRRARPAV